MNKLPIFLLSCVIVLTLSFLTGCGRHFRDHGRHKQELTGESSTTTTTTPAEYPKYSEKALSTVSQCYDLGDGVYIENEGNHIDVYNNSSCAHGPSPKKLLCPNNIHEDDVCWVENRMFSIEGTNSSMVLKILEY